MSSAVVTTIAGGGSLIIATAFLYGVKQIFEIGKNVKQVKEVVLGEPASLGIPARPGALERITNGEQSQVATDKRVDGIADSVTGLATTVTELSKVVHEIKGAVMSSQTNVILPVEAKP